MKNYILLLLLALGTFASCKKDKKTSSAKPIDKAIISTTWLTVNEKYEYFDASDRKLFEFVAPPGVKYVFSRTSDEVAITDLQGKRTNKKYSLQAGDRNYVTITGGNFSETYEIMDYTDKTMNWKQEKTNVTYQDNGTHTAAREVITMDFHCPCRE